MQLRPGRWIVLEGIDAAGKTTQAKLLGDTFPEALVTHQPSGIGALGQAVYALTESYEMNAFTRQMLHLAAHSEHYEHLILPTLLDKGIPVIQDRFWWSTLAYGLMDHALARNIGLDQVIELVKEPAQSLVPDVMFLFMHAHAEDKHNTPGLISNYMSLSYRRWPFPVVKVTHDGNPEFVHHSIVHELIQRDLVKE